MTFEKALEAMKQGKKITYEGSEFYYFMSGENEIRCINFVIGYETTVKFFCSNILTDKWEIYEEPQKEPEMTAEKAIAFLQTVCGSIKIAKKNNVAHILYDGFDEAIDCINFAIEALENQNQTEPKKKSESDSEKWIERAVDNQRIEEEFKDALYSYSIDERAAAHGVE